jgi:uncharacterized RDD family membrane protein YckC
MSEGRFRGSEVTLFRRMAALAIDWLACLAIVKGFDLAGQFTTLFIFFAEVSLLTAFGGASFGHRITKMKVVRFVDGSAPSPIQALIRTFLLCTVIFAITYDENGRGIHERLSGTYLLKTK